MSHAFALQTPHAQRLFPRRDDSVGGPQREGGWRHGLLWASLITVLGCGGESLARRPLQGEVTIDDVAVASGTLAVFPLPGTAGPAATTIVQNGSYVFTTETGPLSGAHRVVLTLNEPLLADSGQANLAEPSAEPTVGQGKQGPAMKEGRVAAKDLTGGSSQVQWSTEWVVPDSGDATHHFRFSIAEEVVP